MSWVDETVLPAVFEELVRLKADTEVIDMVRLAMGTPHHVLEAEHAEAEVEEVVHE